MLSARWWFWCFVAESLNRPAGSPCSIWTDHHRGRDGVSQLPLQLLMLLLQSENSLSILISCNFGKSSIGILCNHSCKQPWQKSISDQLRFLLWIKASHHFGASNKLFDFMEDGHLSLSALKEYGDKLMAIARKLRTPLTVFGGLMAFIFFGTRASSCPENRNSNNVMVFLLNSHLF